MDRRPELTATEYVLPYAEFYDLPITPVPEGKLVALTAGPIDPNLALKIEDCNDLFEPGYLPCGTSYHVMSNGTGLLANHTEMLGVTPEMFKWRFAWHNLEDLRYRTWDPEDHYYTRQQMREKTLDQSLPVRECIWGTIHHVLEGTGPGPDELVLEFHYPHELDCEKEKVGTDACATLICVNGHDPVPGQGVATIITHFVRETPGGIELRSCFWTGYGLVSGRLVKLMPDDISIPEEVPMGLFVYNLKEFGHLAAILPQVYAKNKDNW